MKFFYCLLTIGVISLTTCGLLATTHAAGIEPTVEDFNGSQALKLEVGTGSEDASWASLIFDTPIDLNDYDFLYADFKIYRSSVSGTANEWLSWSFQGANFTPNYGGQLGDVTYPFVGGGTTGTVPTLADQYNLIELAWDFNAGEIYSYVNDSTIDDAYEITPPADFSPLTSFTFSLSNGGIGDGEAVWIDNLFIVAANPDDDVIYEYNFDELEEGLLDGQGSASSHWETGTANAAVPISGAFWLLGSGLIGIVGIRRRIQK